MTGGSAREQIIGAIRAGIADFDAGSLSVPVGAAAKHTAVDRDRLIGDFRRYAAEEAATSVRVAGVEEVPGAVEQYLRENELPLEVLTIGRVPGEDLDWSGASAIEIADRPIRPDGEIIVTGCYAGLAEAGVIVTVSSADFPNEYQFLAETHIVVVPAARLFADFEAFWRVVENEFAGGLPRSMNWIVGPSRTADLGVPSRLGAHGPARLHLVIVDEGVNGSS